jgi:hypothetical protein
MEITVTRTEHQGRYVYAVNGAEIRTSKTKFALAVAGSGNEYHPSGYWLQLSNSYATVNKTLAQYRGLRTHRDMALVDITEG